MIQKQRLQELLSMKSPNDGIISPRRDKRYYMDVFRQSNRGQKVVDHLDWLFSTGRLKDTGYLSILPIDQGVEHSAGNAFAKNPIYFDPENIVRLAIEGGCNAVATTIGGIGIVSKKYAERIPMIVKINHNESLTPGVHKQSMFGTVKNAFDMGAVGVGATIYFGSEDSEKTIFEVSEAFELAHTLGMFTVLWCYVKLDSKFNQELNTSLDFTAQANYLGCTIQADIIKQKMPTMPGGFEQIQEDSMYGKLSSENLSTKYSDNIISMVRYQVLNCLGGKIPMLGNGGPSGLSDLDSAVEAAIINKRAGGSGMILGRKAFQKEFSEGVRLLNEVQNVYLDRSI